MSGRALLLLAALVVSGCGKAGPPVAPERRVPAPVSDLRGVIEERTVALEWTLPHQRADQGRLRELREARLYRTDDEGVVPPKPALLVQGRIAGYREITRIALGEPGPDRSRGRAVRYVDGDDLRHGRRYTYVVITEDPEGRVSAPSNRLSLTLITPPEAPPPPTATAGDGEVRVQWQPPSRLVDGTPVPTPLAHEVLRASTAEGAPEAVLPVAAGQTSYVDKGVTNDRTYHYAVRAIRQEATTTARGPASARVTATPGRLTAPAPASSLVAVVSGDTVRLSWAASPDRSVATYVVYRAGATGGPERIGSVPTPGTTFTDRGLAPGTYRYFVTAQDASARANESAPSNEASVTLP